MRRWLLGAVSVAAQAGCDRTPAVLDAAGHNAARIADLWWLMFWLGAGVWVVVTVLAFHVLFRRRSAPLGEARGERVEGDERSVRWVAAGTLASLVILLVVFMASLLAGRAIQALEREESLAIEVIGHQWWWEVRYLDPTPARRFETANEIRIPVGRPIRLELRSQDVIHSFWVPQLSGKLDLLPGRTNALVLRADEPGVYRAQCAEFCGLQHSRMALQVIAEPPERYGEWAAGQLRPAASPTDSLAAEGQRVFLSSGCVICHTIRGTEARANVGPDLTHLGSRMTLAAGTLPNTRAYLGGWIADPQIHKPGNRMPRVPLDGAELNALLAYLEGLR